MKSIKTMQKEYKLTKMELLIAYDQAIRYYLADEDIETFLIKIMEKKLAFDIARSKRWNHTQKTQSKGRNKKNGHTRFTK